MRREELVDGPSASSPQSGTAASRRSVLVFGVVATALFMSSIDQSMLATALPTLGRSLGAEVNWSGWAISIYSLGLIVAMPLGGRLSDQFGRKRLFLWAILVFTVSSLCCGLAPNIYLLIAFRAVQALGAGIFLPTATGIVADEFPHNRDRIVGSFVSIFPIGAMVGPVIGGLIVSYWSWRGTFLINVPVGLTLLVLGLRFIRPSPKAQVTTIDWRGVLLLVASLLATMVGLARIGDGGDLTSSLGFFVLALVVVLLFLRHAARFPGAFVPIGLLSGRSFGLMNALNFTFGSACLALGALVPLYAQDRYGIDTVSSGTLLTARAFGIALVAGATVMIMRRTGYRLLMVAGFVVIAIGLAMTYAAPPVLAPYAWLALATTITGIGMGGFMPAANMATLHVDPSQVAAITGLRGMFRQLGFLVGVSMTTALIARSGDPGTTQASIYLAFAVIVLAALPLIWLVPDHRGRW